MFVRRKLKVMFDLHGVIETQPEVFKPLMKTMRLAGHKVYICSGPHIGRIKSELLALGYSLNHHYDEVISVADYLNSEGIEFKYDDNDNPWTEPEIWWGSKGKICKKYHIDIVIDDHEEYMMNLEPPTIFLLMK